MQPVEFVSISTKNDWSSIFYCPKSHLHTLRKKMHSEWFFPNLKNKMFPQIKKNPGNRLQAGGDLTGILNTVLAFLSNIKTEIKIKHWQRNKQTNFILNFKILTQININLKIKINIVSLFSAFIGLVTLTLTRSAEAFLFCNLLIKKTCYQKNHVIRPLSSSSLRSLLYWSPSIDISSSSSQVLSRSPAGRRWCLFYLFTFSFYSFYPYLYCCFFLPYRSKNKRVRHPIKKTISFRRFWGSPYLPFLFTYNSFHFHILLVFSISLSLSTIRRFCLLFTIFILSITCFLHIFHFTFIIFRWFCQQPQCLSLFFSPHLSSFKQSLRWNSRSTLS